MLRVPIRKDIAEYKTKIIGKMTLRTLISIGVAVGASLLIGGYMYFALGLDWNVSQFLIMPTCVAIWAFGFWKPMGLPMEQFLPIFIQHAFTQDKCVYVTSFYLDDTVERSADDDDSSVTNSYNRLCKTKGIESWSPSESHIEE